MRFKVKEGYEEEYLEINKSFENLPGQKMSRLFKTGDRTYCLLYTSPSPRDVHLSRMPSSA